MASYEVKIKFATDRELTEEEIGTLLVQFEVQIIEPQTYDGEDIDLSTWIYEPSVLEKTDDRVLHLDGIGKAPYLT